jgi:hypothetical protein
MADIHADTHGRREGRVPSCRKRSWVQPGRFCNSRVMLLSGPADLRILNLRQLEAASHTVTCGWWTGAPVHTYLCLLTCLAELQLLSASASSKPWISHSRYFRPRHPSLVAEIFGVVKFFPSHLGRLSTNAAVTNCLFSNLHTSGSTVFISIRSWLTDSVLGVGAPNVAVRWSLFRLPAITYLPPVKKSHRKKQRPANKLTRTAVELIARHETACEAGCVSLATRLQISASGVLKGQFSWRWACCEDSSRPTGFMRMKQWRNFTWGFRCYIIFQVIASCNGKTHWCTQSADSLQVMTLETVVLQIEHLN